MLACMRLFPLHGLGRKILADKSLISRGSATIMAQMTAAAGAPRGRSLDSSSCRYARAGHGLCNERLARVLCEEAPKRIMEMEEWKVGWARDETGRMAQVMARAPSA